MIFRWNTKRLTVDEVLSRITFTERSVYYHNNNGDSHCLGYLIPEQHKISNEVLKEFATEFLLDHVHNNQPLSFLYLQPHDELRTNIANWCNEPRWEGKEERTSLFASRAFEDAVKEDKTAYFAKFEAAIHDWPKEIQHLNDQLLSQKIFAMEWDMDEDIWECYVDSSSSFETELVQSVRHSLVRHFWQGENYPLSLEDIDFSLISNRELIKELAKATTETDLERDLFRTIPVGFVSKHQDCFRPGSIANSLGLDKDEDYTDTLQRRFELAQLRNSLKTNLPIPATRNKPKLKL